MTELERDRVFEWLAKTGGSGVTDGRHRLEVTALPSGASRLRNVEFVKRTASVRAAPEGFARMNAEIAAQARARHQQTP